MVRLAIGAVFLILGAEQLVCASTVSTVDLSFSGSVAVTDAEGNIYIAGAALPGLQVTGGAAQTQPGGGTCMVSASFIGLVPEPCPDAYVSKVRVSGNTSSVVFATYVGGDTADQATALAVDAAGAEAEVLYAGTAPTLLSGIDQINVRVPDPLTAPGVAVPVNVEAVNGFSTVSGWGATTVAVK
jgi:hypothetical protein